MVVRTVDEKKELSPQELAEQNIRLVGAIVKKHGNLAEIYGYDELFSVGCIGLLKAAFRYNSNYVGGKGTRVKFSTFAGVCTSNEIRLYHRRMKKHSEHMVYIDEPYVNSEGEDFHNHEVAIEDFADSVLDSMADTELIHRVRQVLERVPEKQRTVFLDWLSGRTETDIAEERGLSKSYVSRIISKVKIRLFRSCLGGGGINVQQSDKHGTSPAPGEPTDGNQ